MMRRPDEDHDVIVHQFRKRDGQDIWTIWLAGEKKGARVTLESALELARAVGDAGVCARARPRCGRSVQPASGAAR